MIWELGSFWVDGSGARSLIMNTAIIDITWVLYWKWATSIQKLYARMAYEG